MNENNTEPVVYAVGARGYSAYEVAVQNGFIGTEQEWLDSLKGDAGESAYQIAVEQGYTGTKDEWLASLIGPQGPQGKSAYQVAVDNGYEGTEQEWVNDFLNPEGYLKKSEVIDNLTTNDSTKALSAKQGKNLNDTIQENKQNISQEISTRQNNVSSLQTQINGLASGSPLKANSISEMTDTTRTYVLATDGNWYYYDGDSWEVGGVYQATENSYQVSSNLNRINVLSDLIGKDITNDFEFTDNFQIIAESSRQDFGQQIGSTSFKCSDYVNISKYKILDIVCVVRKYTESAFTGLCFYDNNKQVISGIYFTDNAIEAGYTINKKINIPENAKYIRTSLFLSTATIGTNTVEFKCYEYEESPIEENKKAINKTNEILENMGKEIGYLDMQYIDFKNKAQIVATDGTVYNSINYVCTDFISCDSFNLIKLVMVVRVYNENAHSGIAFYDENKNYISGKNYTDDTVETGYNALKEIFIPENAKYFRTTLFSEDSTHGTNTLPFSCELYSNNKVFGKNYYNDYEVISVPNYPHHDTTVVDDNIWAFNKPSDGPSKIYDLSFNLLKSININLEETLKDETTSPIQMKSVDFNEYNSCLLVGNGKSDYSANDSYLYIFYDSRNWLNSSSTITFDNCGSYTKIDVGELGVKSYGFWAGRTPNLNDQIYVSINYFKDIYLIRLGKGTEQLSKGTYSYIDDDKYNGTYEVLNHWSQEVNFTDEFALHGGQAYNGKLYLVNNDSTKCEIYECELCADGKLKFNILQLQHYLPTKIKKYRFLDGMCIKDGYIYSAPLYIDGNYHTGNNKVVLKIKIDK